MEKRMFYIVMLVLSVLSIIMILISYFGFIRYLTLYLKSIDGYIENYSKLPRANDKKVVISFTTTPDRVDKLEPMIKSLLDQSVKVDMIVMNIPYKYKGKKFPELPKYLEKVVNVYRFNKNYGEGGKLIPTLFREKDCDTIIIVVKDDQVYGQDFVQTMVEEVKKNPGKLVRDEKKTALALTPSVFGCSVVDCNQEVLSDNWFVKHAKEGAITVN